MKSFIIGSGTYVPENIVTNEDLAESLGLDPSYIFNLSGIRRRRWASPSETTSGLASGALHLALKDAELMPKDLDYLLFGTMTADRFIPGSASAVQKQVGLCEIPCLDIRATCCNALYGLQIASALVTSGVARNIAICLAEIQSVWLDLSPRAGKVSMLFGDGASALIISSEPRKTSLQIVDVLLATDGTYIDDLGIRCPGTEFGTTISNQNTVNPQDFQARMLGQSVILQASRKITEVCQLILERNDNTIDDVNWLVPHQANANLLALIARNLQFSKQNNVISVLEDYGNTSSASMGIALDKLLHANLIQESDLLLLPAFGAGFTWGAGLCRAL